MDRIVLSASPASGAFTQGELVLGTAIKKDEVGEEVDFDDDMQENESQDMDDMEIQWWNGVFKVQRQSKD